MRVYNEMRVYGRWESCESRPNCAPLTILISTKIRFHNKKQKHKNSKYMFFCDIGVVEVCWSLFSGKAVMHDLGYGRDPTWILDFWPGPRYVEHTKYQRYILWKHIFKLPIKTGGFGLLKFNVVTFHLLMIEDSTVSIKIWFKKSVTIQISWTNIGSKVFIRSGWQNGT